MSFLLKDYRGLHPVKNCSLRYEHLTVILYSLGHFPWNACNVIFVPSKNYEFLLLLKLVFINSQSLPARMQPIHLIYFRAASFTAWSSWVWGKDVKYHQWGMKQFSKDEVLFFSEWTVVKLSYCPRMHNIYPSLSCNSLFLWTWFSLHFHGGHFFDPFTLCCWGKWQWLNLNPHRNFLCVHF